MLQRFAPSDLLTPLPPSRVHEEPVPPPGSPSRKATGRLDRHSVSRESPGSAAARHRSCCQPVQGVTLPAVLSKPPPKTLLLSQFGSSKLRAAPQVPQAPLRPLRSSRGYPFSSPRAGLGGELVPWLLEDDGMGGEGGSPPASAPAGDVQRILAGEADEAAAGGFLAKFKSSTDASELPASPQRSLRPPPRAPAAPEPEAPEPPPEPVPPSRRTSEEAAEQLRLRMRQALFSREAPPAPPPEPRLQSGDSTAIGSRGSPRKRSHRGVSFAQDGQAGAGPEPTPPPSSQQEDAKAGAGGRRSLRGDAELAAVSSLAPSADVADAGGEPQAGASTPGAARAASPTRRGAGAEAPAPPAPEVAPPLPSPRVRPRSWDRARPKLRPASTLKSTLQERVRRLERRHLQRAQQQKVSREQDLRRQQFNELPQAEVDAIQRAFLHVDADGRGYIDQAEVTECLNEMGLRGTNTLEKREIAHICTEAVEQIARSAPGGEAGEGQVVDIISFALVVVPRVRERLGDLRSNELLRVFYSFDIRGTGKLPLQQCMLVAQDMGIDRVSFGRIAEELHGNKEGGVDFEEFQEIVVRARENADRLVRERERRIKEATGISDEAFQQFRRDIVDLHQLFQHYDTEGRGTLGPDKVPAMLTEFGLMPRSPHERSEVDNMLRETDRNGDGCYSFEEFLHLTSKVRTMLQERKRAALLQFFERYDRDKSGNLSVEELSALLCDLGIVPMNRKEQEELAALIQLVDTDGSGFVEFDEFVDLAQRIDQRLRSMRYEEEIEYALSLNFTESQMRDMRLVFISLDVDGSNKLDAHEVKNGLAMMNKQVTTEAFDAAFKALDADGSGELDFLEFLDFMRTMRDGEGIFSEDTTHLPTRVRLLDRRVLRRVVEHFGIAKTYVSALGQEELSEIFCNRFDLSQNENIQERLGISHVSELFEVAKRRGNEVL